MTRIGIDVSDYIMILTVTLPKLQKERIPRS